MRTKESLLLKSQLTARITFLFHNWIQNKLSQQRKKLSSNILQSIKEGFVVTETTSSESEEEKKIPCVYQEISSEPDAHGPLSGALRLM